MLILLAIGGRLLLSSRSPGVYPIFAEAARHWLRAQDLYQPVGEPYRYSPLAAVLFVPFSSLPDPFGGLLWRWFNAGVYLATLAWWCRAVLPVSLSPKQRGLFFLLIIPLSVGSLNNGQSNPLVLGLLLAAGAAVTAERWNLASGCLALACLFKLYPIAVGLLLVLGYPRRLGGRLLAALALGLGAPFLLGRFDYVADQYVSWVRYLLADDRQTWPLPGGYRDVRMLFRLWLTPLSGSTYLTLQLLVAGGIALVCLANRSITGAPRSFLTTALVLGGCWMTVFGPATESSTYMLLAPALAWALLNSFRRAPAPVVACSGDHATIGESGDHAATGLARGLRLNNWVHCGILIISFAIFAATQVLLWFPRGSWFQNLGTQPFAGLLSFGSLVFSSLRPGVGICPGRLESKVFPAYDRAA
jgi:hypothetical protein